MAQEQTAERDAPNVPRVGCEVLDASLLVALNECMQQFPEGTRPTIADVALDPERRKAIVREILDHLDVQGYTLTRDLYPLTEQETREDERRKVAGALTRARLRAARAFEKHGPEGCIDGAYIECHAKELDALTDRLERGGR